MEPNNITLHQAFYGEVNRAHSCIQQTIVDPELTSFLIAFTDRPAALPPGVNLHPYLSGSAYTKYYVFTKTYSDQSATRAGMVFTHVIIVDQSDIASIHNLKNIFSLFVDSTDNKNNELKAIDVDFSNASLISEGRNQPEYIQQIISSFIKGVNPILFSGDISIFSNALQQIWSSPDVEERKKLKYRTSFTPSDIENVNDLTIVSIQKEFLPKWQGQAIIHGWNQDVVEITSDSEALFLGCKEENPFHNFLIELNIDIEDVKNYGQYEKVFLDYISLDKNDDANVLRQDIRVLSISSPLQVDGVKIKDKFIERLSVLIKNKLDTNIKALRNIDWSAFSDGEEKVTYIVSEFIVSEIESPDQNKFKLLAELIDISYNESTKNWWHLSVNETIVSVFKEQKVSSLKNIWQLMELSDDSLSHIFLIVSAVKGCDNILRKSIPKKLKIETCKALASFSKKKKWYLFHAEILLKYLSIDIVLKKQLEIEDHLSLAYSFGVKYIVEKLTADRLIQEALNTCNSKLIKLSADEIIKNISLLKELDPLVPAWLYIWAATIHKTKAVFNGLQGREQEVVFSVLDLIVKGENVDSTLVDLISDTKYSDITEYNNRNIIWGVLTPVQKEKFLNSTTQGVLKNLLSENIKVTSIETEISDRIISDDFMTTFLNENRGNIEPVIALYSRFKSLKDDFLSDYIKYFLGTITVTQANKLGDLVLNNVFNKSAKSIYEKTRYNSSFKPAFENCKNLVNLHWWDLFSSTGSSSDECFMSKPYKDPSLIGGQLGGKSLPVVVILTAIIEEYLAVKQHLKNIVEVDENDTSYEAGVFEFNGIDIATIFIRECGAKNTTASQETERAIQNFKPDAMFFVGIAGSRKPKDLTIGDVIFPEKVYFYEGGKSEKDSFVSRPEVENMTFTLMETAKKERRKEDWKILIKGDWKQEVTANIGIIASGEQVVEHYNSGIGRILTEFYNDTSAVEMEGYGFAKAANRQGRETSNVLIGIVRGISDIIEQPSSTNENIDADRRPSNAKQFASDTAAAFTYWLILKTYEG